MDEIFSNIDDIKEMQSYFENYTAMRLQELNTKLKLNDLIDNLNKYENFVEQRLQENNLNVIKSANNIKTEQSQYENFVEQRLQEDNLNVIKSANNAKININEYQNNTRQRLEENNLEAIKLEKNAIINIDEYQDNLSKKVKLYHENKDKELDHVQKKDTFENTWRLLNKETGLLYVFLFLSFLYIHKNECGGWDWSFKVDKVIMNLIITVTIVQITSIIIYITRYLYNDKDIKLS